MIPIQPLASRPPEISVTTPISQALDRVKRVLFQPFDLGRWFILGFGAWLAHLGEQGWSGGGNYGGGSHHGGSGGPNFQRALEHAKDYLTSNFWWIGPVIVAVVVFGLALWVLFTWLNSRGKFIFLHCVALNQAEVVAPWNQFAGVGNSLWRFRLGLGLVGMAVMLPLLALIIVPVFKMVLRGAPNAAGIVVAVGALLGLIVVAIGFALIGKLLADFVVPIMFLRGKQCLAGWSELGGLLAAHPGSFVLYFLMQLVLGMASGVLVLVVILATCCLAGCFMMVPYLGTVLLLPVLVFQRAYSLHFLAQFGPAYDVFPPAASPLFGVERGGAGIAHI
ncbi:MAG: hypothetical protein V9H26_01705 [Verrucomicrobiota bacterium]|nr:hypothetical protein [Verrucomicrobiota bacterium]MCC6821877.1 hypothetical protein [Limisphaerales bacterium]